MSEESDRRRVSLPIWGDEYAWWTEAVKSKVKPQNPAGPDQKDLAAKLGFSPSEVSRAIKREKPLYDIVIAISTELEIPYPVLLPESEDEALHLATQRRLFRRDRQLSQVRPPPPKGAGSPPSDRAAKRASKRR